MKLVAIICGVIVALSAVVAVGIRIPVFQDALFERAIERVFESSSEEALFRGDGLKIVFCGTGSPLPSAKRAQSCTAIVAGDRYFLVDAGTGSWGKLASAGVPANRLRGVFLTHFHSDHIGDLSEVNLASWIMGREEPLAVYGPQGVIRVVSGVNEAYELDDVYRTAHHGKGVASPRTARMVAITFDGSQPSTVYEEDGLKITAFPVAHNPVAPAVGYRFDYDGRSVVISGDTAFSENVISAAKNVDLLVHEAQANHMVAMIQNAASKAGNVNLATVLSDIPSYHTTPEMAADIANRAGVEWLVLTHLTPAPDNTIMRRMFMRGVSGVRRNKVRIADDGMIVSLPAAGGVTFSRL